MPQREQLANTPSSPRQKKKKQSRLSRAPNREVGESQGEREPHVGEREGDQSGSMERRGRARKKSLPRRSRRQNEWVSGRKSFPGRSAESWFHSKSGQTCNRKEGRETKSPLIR